MVMEAQIESGALGSQNSGGPLNVTKMLAAICSTVKIPVQAHSNPTFDVENEKILGPANAKAIQSGIAIALKSRKEAAPST